MTDDDDYEKRFPPCNNNQIILIQHVIFYIDMEKLEEDTLYNWYIHSKQRAIEKVDRWYETGDGSKAGTSSSKALRSIHKPTNFVSGDTNFVDFQNLLISLGLDSDEIFVDLGCGVGECVAAAAILHCRDCANITPFKQILGVDMQKSKLLECKFLIETLCEKTYEHGKTLQLPVIDILEEDFLQIDWSHGSIIYACATCFTPSMFEDIVKKCLLLREGSKVIFLDKEIPSEYLMKDFRPLNQIVMKTSWGQGTAYVYSRY